MQSFTLEELGAGERSAAYVAEIERGRKRRREAAAGRPAKRARATPVTRKRSRAAAADDSDDEEITVAELRAQLREQRAEVDRIRRQWKRDGLGDQRGKKRKPGQ